MGDERPKCFLEARTRASVGSLNGGPGAAGQAAEGRWRSGPHRRATHALISASPEAAQAMHFTEVDSPAVTPQSIYECVEKNTVLWKVKKALCTCGNFTSVSW